MLIKKGNTLKKIITFLSLALLATACGSTTVIKEVAPSTTAEPVKETVVVTVPVQVPTKSTNKYDDYMDHVLNNSGQANSSWTKSQLIEFGDLVCGALDNRSSVRDVVNLMNQYAVTSSDTELFVSVLVGAVMNLCPEYQYDLESYIRS